MPKFSIEELKTLASSKNIAENLPEEDLEAIGKRVVDEYEDDYGLMSDKIEKWDEILDFAMQVEEEKNFPWPGASNIQYPIISSACIRFAARMYPEIVQTGRVARVKVNGQDPEGTKQERAIRVEDHLNFQISEEIPNWESDTDVLLSLLPAYGCYYRKVFYCPIEKRPVVEICNPKSIITSNCSTSLETEKRITQDDISLNSNEIIERIRAGLFLNVDIESDKKDSEEEQDEEFIEQHCYLDLDEDGYGEPYVVTAHKESKTVMRIVARFTEDDIDTATIEGKEVISKIHAFTHYVKYILMPAFDGSTTGLGMGELLMPLNDQINTMINQLTDAGTLQNVQGGFIGRGVRMDGGPFRLSMGEWIPVETRGGSLRDNIMQIPTNEPSQTLFALLGMLTEAADGLAASNQAVPGEIPMNTPATTFLGLIEEGMKVYSSIHKRIQNAVKQELRKIYHLNKMFGDPEKYLEYHDDEQADMLADYSFRDTDISPVASPEVSSDMQRMVKAQGLVDLLDRQGVQAGGLDPRAVVRKYLEATREQEIDTLQPPLPPPSDEPPLEEKMMDLQADIEIGKIEVAEKKVEVERLKAYIDGIKKIAEAESLEEGDDLNVYKQAVQEIKDTMEMEERSEALNQQRAQAAQQVTNGKAKMG